VAALIEQETGLRAALVVGGRGEFTVHVDEETVAAKDANGFPTDDAILMAVRNHQGR
jgi:hypothetical protein